MSGGVIAVGTAAGGSEERSRILAALVDDLDALTDRAVEAMQAEIPAYAAQDERFFADVRDQVVRHYRTKLAAFLDERTVTLDDIAFVRGAAMRRARAGLALEDYINAFRVGQQVFWEAVVEVAGDTAAGHEAALSLAAPLMRYCDFASTHAAHAYVEFQQHARGRRRPRAPRPARAPARRRAAHARGPLLAVGAALRVRPATRGCWSPPR